MARQFTSAKWALSFHALLTSVVTTTSSLASAAPTSGADSRSAGRASGLVSGTRSAGCALPVVTAEQPLTDRHSSAASAGRRGVIR
ncbi:hypothetical protein ACQ86B_15160 [Mycolicibacterium aichiense]|uniref:hypothetical protein n=1 Tax=Mycolicibacterium aichiense TaxID=1799 RepID=UPI003D6755FD